MKISEIISEDISRRGFLRGAGAAAAGAASSAMANPFNLNVQTDQMTDRTSKWNSVESDNGNAQLHIMGKNTPYPQLTLYVPGKTLNLGSSIFKGKMRFGSDPAFDVSGYPISSTNSALSIYVAGSGPRDGKKNNLMSKVENYSGVVKIQFQSYGDDLPVYVFTIEPGSNKMRTNEEQVEEDATPDSISQINKLTRKR